MVTLHEFSTLATNWLLVVGRDHRDLPPPLRNVLEIEVRVGTIDLRHGHKARLCQWGEDAAKLDLAACPPSCRNSFLTGLSEASLERADLVVTHVADGLATAHDEDARMQLVDKLKAVRSEWTEARSLPFDASCEHLHDIPSTKGYSPRSRVVRAPDGVKLETKYRITEESETKLVLPGMTNDIKLSALLESSRALDSAEIKRFRDVAANYTDGMTRIKKRVVLQSSGDDNLWEVHRTQIEDNMGRIVAHELEFEIADRRHFWEQWVGDDEPVAFCQNASRQLLELLLVFLQATPAPIPPSIHPFDSNMKQLALQKSMLQRISELCADFDGFPGPNPVALDRGRLGAVRGADKYFVSEKTNGTRFVLVNLALEEDPTARVQALMGRDGCLHTRTDLADCGVDVMLDGELVHDLGLGRFVFVAFDVLAVDRESLVAQTFETRECVLRSLRGRIQQAPSDLPLQIKTWVRPNRVYDCLESQMSPWRGTRTIRNEAGHHHASDGYICIPSTTPFVSRTDVDMFKYKEPQDLTADFFIDLELLRRKLFRSPHLVYYGGGFHATKSSLGAKARQHNPPQYVEASIGQHEACAILSTMPANERRCVGEFRWKDSRWHFLFLRPDKQTCNAPRTVQSTLVALQDHLTLGEFLISLCRKRKSVDELLLQREHQLSIKRRLECAE